MNRITLLKDFHIVKYGAAWCSSCVILEKTLKKLPKEIKWYLVDIDTMDKLEVQQKLIRSVPLMTLIIDGEEVSRLNGNQPESVILKWLVDKECVDISKGDTE